MRLARQPSMADHDRAPQAGTMAGGDEGDRAVLLLFRKGGSNPTPLPARLRAWPVHRSSFPAAGPAVSVDLPGGLGTGARELLERAVNG